MTENVQDEHYLQEFGIINCNKTVMTKVNARVLKSPNVYYENHKVPRIDNGKWRMANNMKFYAKIKLQFWMVVWIVKMPDEKDLEYYKGKLFEGIKHSFPLVGLDPRQPKFLYLPDKSMPEVFNTIRQASGTLKPQIVMFVFNETHERDEIKKIAENDKTYGLMTQCIKFDKFSAQIDPNANVASEDRKLNMYLSNLSLKINAKLGGTNSLVDYSVLQE